MLTNLLTNHPNIYAVLLFLYALFEYWIGKTPTTRAGSFIELIGLGWNRIFGKKEPTTVIVDKNQKVAKETREVLDAVLVVVRDFKAGLKPQEVAAKDFAAIMAALQDADQIKAEQAADPDAFAATIGAGIAQLIQLLLGGAVSPKP